MSISYKDSGVDIHLGDKASKILYEASRETWGNRAGRLGEVVTPFDDFTGLRMMEVGKLPEGTVLGIGFDGVGTKIEISERISRHDTIAHDLFAMVCDDAVVRGGEPVVVGTVLDVNSLGNGDEGFIDFIKQLAEGYVNAAQEARVAVVNGEVAELGVRVNGYGSFNYNWSAGVIWFARKDRMFTGYEIEPDDFLVGLKEEGFRSNGLSLVRRVLAQHHGEHWQFEDKGGAALGELVLRPSSIYTKAVVEMTGGAEGAPRAEVHGVAHITGGGIPGKLGRILKPRQMGAVIDSPFVPGEIVLYCQGAGGVLDEDAYQTWNMGQGMVIVTPEPEPVIKIAQENKIEAKIIGKVKSAPGIEVLSQGIFKKNKVLNFI